MNEFIWTDENIIEFIRFTQRRDRDNTGYYSDIEEFKKSKQKPILFTTEDNVAIYEEGVIAWLVKDDKDYSCSSYSFRKEYLNLPTWHLFSTEDAAKSYVNYHKPSLSLAEIHEEFFGNQVVPNDYYSAYNQLKELVKQKITQ